MVLKSPWRNPAEFTAAEHSNVLDTAIKMSPQGSKSKQIITRATLTYTVIWKSQRLSLERHSDLFWSFTQALPSGSLWREKCHQTYWVLNMSGQRSARWTCPKQDVAQINPAEVMLRYSNNCCSGNRLLPDAPRWVEWQLGDSLLSPKGSGTRYLKRRS